MGRSSSFDGRLSSCDGRGQLTVAPVIQAIIALLTDGRHDLPIDAGVLEGLALRHTDAQFIAARSER